MEFFVRFALGVLMRDRAIRSLVLGLKLVGFLGCGVN